MRVFIPTKGRAATINSHRLFPDMDVFIVVHNQAERDAYLANSTIQPGQLLVSGVKADAYGLTRQREWIMQHCIQPGEWFVFADDNIRRILIVPSPYYFHPVLHADDMTQEIRLKTFRAEATAETMQLAFRDSREAAESIGAQLVGFAVTDHTLMRGRKFRAVGYVSGKLMLMQHNTIPFDHTITMEDFRNTAEHLRRNGAVLINNYVAPIAKHYEPGGMGLYAERLAYRKADVKRLMVQYPGLFRLKNRKGFEPGTDLAVKLTTRAQVVAWRASLLGQPML